MVMYKGKVKNLKGFIDNLIKEYGDNITIQEIIQNKGRAVKC